MRLITMDVHSDTCTAGVFQGKNGETFKVEEKIIPTRIADLKEFLQGRRSYVLVIEEGPMASWLKRHLEHCVKRFVVADPRRNALIARNPDKNDSVDIEDLATLYAMRKIREVYHTDSLERQQFKDTVLHHHDLTAQLVAVKLKIKAFFRAHGIRPKTQALLDKDMRTAWLDEIASETLPAIPMHLFAILDVLEKNLARVRKLLLRQAARYPAIKRFQEIAGVGLIVACSFFAIIDTPWRFASIKDVFRYCGLAVVKRSSNGVWLSRPRLNRDSNKILKNMLMTAAQNCIGSRSIMGTYYEHHLRRGISPTAARNHTARKIAEIMIGMWKNNTVFDPRKVCACDR